MGLFSSEFFVSLETLGQTHLGLAWPVVYNLLKIMLIVVFIFIEGCLSRDIVAATFFYLSSNDQ